MNKVKGICYNASEVNAGCLLNRLGGIHSLTAQT